MRYTRDEPLRADLRGIRKEATAAGNIRFAGEIAGSHCDRFWAKALALHAGKSIGNPYNGRFIFPETRRYQVIMERRNRKCEG